MRQLGFLRLLATAGVFLGIIFYPAIHGRVAGAMGAPLTLVVNGVPAEPDVPARIVDGRTLVPLRFIAEQLGAQVSWEPRDRRVGVRGDGLSIDLVVGRREAVVSGDPVTLDVPALIVGGRTMVPLRFLGESLGAQVSYDEDSRTVAVDRPTPLALSTAAPLAGRVIVVDPGHGGDDPGAVGPGGVTEAQITLAMARRLKVFLEGMGAQVVMTRTANSAVGLYERARISDRAGADAFVSLHINASDYRSVHGIQTYHFPGAAGGRRLAAAIHKRVVARAGRTDRGVIAEDFVVTREPRAPAVLVECGYMTNRAEAGVIVTSSYQENVVRGVADGLAAFFTEQHVLSLRR